MSVVFRLNEHPINALIGTLLGKTVDACGADLAAAEGYEYLDVQHLTTSQPQGIVGSPCGAGHHFGVLADAQALTLT